MTVAWSARAKRRALEAAEHIARERPAAAAAWLDQLLERTANLNELASRGRIVPEIANPAYREIRHEPYRVIYRVDAKRVVILTLRHWRRAWDAAEVTRR